LALNTVLFYRPAIWAVQVRQNGLAIEKRQIFEMQDLLVVELRSPHLTCGQNVMKRIFDLACATALLLLFSLLLLVTAALD
jgi:lipopolysaccharide/colanic/teichoic acid biosynthesis glycosyltransferase